MRKIILSLLALSILPTLVFAQAEGIVGASEAVNAITTALGTLTNIAWIVGLFVFVGLEYKAIIVLTFIFVTEAMFKLDLAGSFTTLSAAILTGLGGKSLVSLVPSLSSSNDVKTQLYKMATPFKLLVNMNRATLYTAFFLFFITSFPFYIIFNFPSVIIGTIFNFANNLVLVYEPLFFGVFLIIILTDNLADAVNDTTGIFK